MGEREKVREEIERREMQINFLFCLVTMSSLFLLYNKLINFKPEDSDNE